MISKISEGVEIKVETTYEPSFSNSANREYMFSYKITIINLNNFSVQLLFRHWDIIESNLERREVDGDGVVGLQPVIHPNNIFTYTSGCSITCEIGKMQGYYIMQNLNNMQNFKVQIPSFNLLVPAVLN